ncbi:MAG: PEP-CTERM sorting domain-containing protein [FCB group bacterium]|nr:PEP-CTERM sorting domain-containing protein [FCB group bacterium]
MKKAIMLFLVLFAFPSICFGLGSFWISNAYLRKLDNNSYRLRVNVAYDPIHFTYGEGVFQSFSLGPFLGTSQYNPTMNSIEGPNEFYNINTPGSWYGFINNTRPWGLSSNEFGYDFDIENPIIAPLQLSYSALFMSDPPAYPIPYDDPLYNDNDYMAFRNEGKSFSGVFSVGVVPEPATIFLFGFGLVGLGLVKRK